MAAEQNSQVKRKNEKVGQVVSTKMRKTVVVEVTRRVPHPVYPADGHAAAGADSRIDLHRHTSVCRMRRARRPRLCRCKRRPPRFGGDWYTLLFV